jgi:hypothetical protein
MVNAREAGVILRGSGPLPSPLSVGSDPCSGVAAVLQALQESRRDGLAGAGTPLDDPQQGRERQYGAGIVREPPPQLSHSVHRGEHGRRPMG